MPFCGAWNRALALAMSFPETQYRSLSAAMPFPETKNGTLTLTIPFRDPKSYLGSPAAILRSFESCFGSSEVIQHLDDPFLLPSARASLAKEVDGKETLARDELRVA